MNETKFWSSMQKTENGCWNWTRAVGSGGYGQVSFRGSSWGAHRLGWTLARAAIPDDGTVVAHRCDNRLCCNPDHLFLTDASGNQRDCLMKGRATAAKLCEQDVREIIAAIQAGEATRAIATRFGVFALTIRAIAKRKSWRHLTEATGELKLAPRACDPRKWQKADYEKIRALLKTGGLSYREIARRADTTHTTVRRVALRR